MSCLPSSTKCEWRDLRFFVNHLNETESDTFERTECLDLCSTSSQPEVLCTNADGATLVIERKAVVWPRGYAERHHAEHRLWDELNSKLELSEPFELCLGPLAILRDDRIRRVAQDLSAKIGKLASELGPGESRTDAEPIPFSLRREFPGERDSNQSQVGLSISSASSPPYGFVDGSVPSEFCDEIARLLASAEKKFGSHISSRRILLFQVVSGELQWVLTDDSWRTVLNGLTIPDCVSEIWTAFNIENDHWVFSCLMRRDPDVGSCAVVS